LLAVPVRELLTSQQSVNKSTRGQLICRLDESQIMHYFEVTKMFDSKSLNLIFKFAV